MALARSLSEALGPMTAVAAVYSVSGGLAVVSLLRSKERRRRILRLPVRYLAGCGVLFVAYMLVLFLAIGWADGRQQVLEVGLLNYLWPALTLVFSLVLLGNRASWLLIPGTLLALAGVFLVITDRTPVSWRSFSSNVAGSPAAYSLALAAAVIWATYSNLTRKWAGDREEGGVDLFLPLMTILLLPVWVLNDGHREWSGRAVAEAVFLGGATYAAYALWDHAMRRGRIILVAAASYLTPLLSTIVSCFYLTVVPGPKLWIGCSILVLGSILSWQSISVASERKAT